MSPGRYWYVVAGFSALLGIAAGICAFVYTIANTPDVEHTFSGGQSTTIYIEADDAFAIYLNDDNYGQIALQDPVCTVTSADGGRPGDVDSYQGSVTFSNGGNSWHAYADISVPASGDYVVECGDVGPADDVTDAYGVGEKYNVGWLVAGILAVFALPGLGCFTAAIIVIIVAVRRNNHRSRLLYQRHYDYTNLPSPGQASGAMD